MKENKKKMVFQFSQKLYLLFILFLLIGAALIFCAVSVFVNGKIAIGILICFLLLGWLFGFFIMITRRVVFYEKTMKLPKEGKEERIIIYNTKV